MLSFELREVTCIELGVGEFLNLKAQEFTPTDHIRAVAV